MRKTSNGPLNCQELGESQKAYQWIWVRPQNISGAFRAIKSSTGKNIPSAPVDRQGIVATETAIVLRFSFSIYLASYVPYLGGLNAHANVKTSPTHCLQS
jgi:hypothetical protein